MGLEDLIDIPMRRDIRQAAECTLLRYYGLTHCDPEHIGRLDEIKKGVFVTLKRNGNLRGCIGFIEPEGSLLKSVMEAALLAATEDPRFIPVSEDEVGELEMEITILDAPEQLDVSTGDGISRIEIGKHGLMIESHFGKGLLLPQVATEWGFDREQFLGAACMKAGIERDSWKKEGVRVYYFEAISF